MTEMGMFHTKLTAVNPFDRETGYAILRVDEFETIDEVVFGRDNDMRLLGAQYDWRIRRFN